MQPFNPAYSVQSQVPGQLSGFTSGELMDARAVVGGIYALRGSVTGAIIALLECVTVSPVTYLLRGPIGFLYSTDGEEFSGVFKPVALGAATFSWGSGAGDRATAGLITNGDGAVQIEGLAGFSSVADVNAIARISDLTATPGYGAWGGFVNPLVPTAWAGGGGVGVNPGGQYASVAVAGALATPTLTPNTAYVAPPTTTTEVRLRSNNNLYLAASAGAYILGGCMDIGGQGQTPAPAVFGTSNATSHNRILAFGGRGGIKARILIAEVTGQAA